MIIKLVSALAFSATFLLAVPVVPELPAPDTGVSDDTGMAMGDEDTGMALDTGSEPSDEEGQDDTGADNVDQDTGLQDTGLLEDTGATSGSTDGTAAATYSASELSGEKGDGCSTAGMIEGPWLLALFAVVLGRRRE